MTSYCCPITQSQPYYRQSSWNPPLHWPKHTLSQTQFVTILSPAKKKSSHTNVIAHAIHTHTCVYMGTNAHTYTNTCMHVLKCILFLSFSVTHTHARWHTKVPAGLFEMQTPMSQQMILKVISWINQQAGPYRPLHDTFTYSWQQTEREDDRQGGTRMPSRRQGTMHTNTQAGTHWIHSYCKLRLQLTLIINYYQFICWLFSSLIKWSLVL